MKIKEIASLASKGYSYSEIKEILTSERKDDLMEMITAGLSLADAKDALTLTDESDDKPDNRALDAGREQEDAGEDHQQEAGEDWERKYKELLKKEQLRNQQQETGQQNQKSDAEVLRDLARDFM